MIVPTDPLLVRQRQRGTEARITRLTEQIRQATIRRTNAQDGVAQSQLDIATAQAELNRVNGLAATQADTIAACDRQITAMQTQIEQLTAAEELAVVQDEHDQAAADLASARATVYRLSELVFESQSA